VRGKGPIIKKASSAVLIIESIPPMQTDAQCRLQARVVGEARILWPRVAAGVTLFTSGGASIARFWLNAAIVDAAVVHRGFSQHSPCVTGISIAPYGGLSATAVAAHVVSEN
jgi:hypothetical protein